MSADPRRFGRDAGGATVVEFALVLPIFLTVMLGIFEFGWAQHKLSTIRFATEIAARRLMLDPTLTESQLTTIVKDEISGAGDANVTVGLSINQDANGKVAKLTAGYVSSIGIPNLASFPINWTTSVSTPLPPA